MRFPLTFFLIVTAIALLFGVPCPALATEYFVKIDGDDTDDGTNWATAFLTISNAVAQTEDGDKITVSNGTYNVTAQIYITNGITVQSTNGAANTIVDGGYPGTTNRCFYLNHASAVLDGFTITNGYYTGSAGGLYVIGATVRNCVITKCEAVNFGGLYLDGGTLENCVITKCVASGSCGGLRVTNGGMVTNCSIINNSAASRAGLDIYLNSTVVNCTISGNEADPTNGKGGGVLNNGGTLRNCLISGNSGREGGGVYLNGDGTVENCTISRNAALYAYGSGGGGVRGVVVSGKTGTVENTIIYFNTAPPGLQENRSGSVIYSYTCTTPAVGGTSNITDDPLLKDATNDNYRLRPGSPCIDVGTNQAWMSVATDLDGIDRIINGTVDMGAYEFAAGDLICGFAADSLEGFDPHTVVFTGYVSGTNLNGLGYQWDVDNNGSIDYQGSTVSVVTNTYTSGLYTVVLTVTNAVGETNTFTRADYISVGPATSYVDSASASPAYPYSSWATAATNIQAAVDAGVDGTLVLVTDGTYEVSSQVLISDAITVQSVNGPEVTTIKAMANVRCVRTEEDADAVVDGFTITKDSSTTYGGGVYMYYGGVVRNCIIKNNAKNATTEGGGVYLYRGGTVSNCTISGNKSKEAGGVGFYYGGIVSDCVITGNWTIATGDKDAGGARLQGGTLRNCLVADNKSVNNRAGGVYCMWGTVESCTISENWSTKSAASAVGGLYIGPNSATVRNCIIYFNTNTETGSTTNWYRDSAGTISYSCTIPDASAYGTNNITGDPVFNNADAGDYRLRSGSPCVNAGTNQAWMTGAVDLGGDNRIEKGTVDMGAYEMGAVGTIVRIR